MERRNFLQKLGGALIGVAVAPNLIGTLDKSKNTESTLKLEKGTNIKTLKSLLDNLSVEDRDWTEAFFQYLKKNNVGFDWERVYQPCFITKIGRVYNIQSRATNVVYNPFWEGGVCETSMQSLSGWTSSFYQPKSIEEYQDKLFFRICSSIRKEKHPKLYIYSLALQPNIINPISFETGRHILIRETPAKAYIDANNLMEI